jgi:hypothetical protein
LRKTPFFSPKIAENCDHNIDPRKAMFEEGDEESCDAGLFPAELVDSLNVTSKLVRAWIQSALLHDDLVPGADPATSEFITTYNASAVVG